MVVCTGVALLPFVDEVRLKEALQTVYPDVTDVESKCNSLYKLMFENHMYDANNRNYMINFNWIEHNENDRCSLYWIIYFVFLESRNTLGTDRLFVGKDCPAFAFCQSLYESPENEV